LKLKKISLIFLQKIKDIHKTINDSGNIKPKINITTKDPFKKQIIVPMGFANISKQISLSSKHIANINRTLKNIKSDIFADFVHTDHRNRCY